MNQYTSVTSLFRYMSASENGTAIEDSISSEINWVDWLAIGLYFAVISVVGIWTSWKKKETVDDYFLAGRDMHWIPVGASLFASNVGSEHFVGLAGSGASLGIGMAQFEFTAMLILLMLGWLFMPIYLSSNVATMPEYLQKRFGGQRIRIYLSLLALILYIFTKISAALYAGSLFIKILLNLDNIYLAILILLFVSAIFTIFGGLVTVMWTEFVQVFVMAVGSLALTFIALQKVGGYGRLFDVYGTAGIPTDPDYVAYRGGCNITTEPNGTCESCSKLTPYYANLFRPIDDPELPWPGIFGAFLSGVWYWCTDQVIVQRALSAKNLTHAKAGCTLGSVLKILVPFMLIIPGMAARVLWPNQIGCSDPAKCEHICGSTSGCTNLAYPYLVIKLMPIGATGLMVSVIIAALMSSLTSIFNSASTIFIVDIYKRFRRRASEIEQIIVGRFFVLFLVAVSIVWIPILEASNNSQLFQYIQSVTSFLSPPVCAVYVLSMFWDRTTEPAAFWSLVIGLLIGLARMILEFAIPAPVCSSHDTVDHRPVIVSKVHYLHFGIILFAISSAIVIIGSLLTKKPDPKTFYRFTHSTIHSEEVREEREVDREDDSDPKSGRDGQNDKDGMAKWISVVCCVSRDKPTAEVNGAAENNMQQQLSEQEIARIHANQAKDDPKWSGFVNAAAIVMVFVSSFFWGYFA